METPPIEHVMPSEPPVVSGLARQGKAFVFLTAMLLVFTGFVVIFEKIYPLNQAGIGQSAAAASVEGAFASLDIQAQGVFVEDAATHTTLYEKNPDAQLPLASLTKVALALAVSEALPRDTVITIPYDTAPSGSAERLAKGEKWSVTDIIDFTLVASSNAGAEILAGAADSAMRALYKNAPEGEATLWRMNQFTRDLGLSHTYFLNVSGLDISPTLSGTYGSARDVAKLFYYAATFNPSLFSGTRENGVVLTGQNGTTRAFNTNESLAQIPGLIMGKTGITDLAGGNLAIVFEVGPAHPVVAVVLGSTRGGRFSDIEKIVSATQQAISQTQ